MIRVLILEDSPEQRDALIRAIQRAFEGSTIKTAGNVEDAQRIINSSFELQEPFSVVIADVKVPATIGKQPGAYQEWVQALDFLDRGRTLIVPISAYLSEDRVRELAGDSDQASTPLPKGPLFTEKLVSRVAKWIIGREMDLVFGPRGEPRPLQLEMSRSVAPVTIPMLSDHIRQLWRRLGSSDRERVREHFDVKEQPGSTDEVESITLASRI